MRPFLLLSIRADDAAADNEYEAFGALAELAEGELRRVRLEQRALGDVDLRDWSGIFLGGGPFNFTDPPKMKSPVQRRVEEDLSRLLDGVVAADFPFLGACYGIGALGSHEGAVVGRRYAEPVGTVRVTVTAPGRQDPLLRRPARRVRRVHRAQGGDQRAAGARGPAGHLGRLPGAGVPGGRPRLRHPVPSRAGRDRGEHPR